MNADGHWRQHGERRQFNYASPRYRQLCALIVAQLAHRFGHSPNVVGWQIGNEYSDESFDPATRAQFQQFLHDKYKTLDNLNQHWATAYWSQTYTAWDQIPMQDAHENPGLLLEHKHFVTATWRSVQKNQIDVLRPLILPTQFITTNIGGLAWSDNWDHYAITADLDLASWDDYVGQGHLDAPKNAMLNDFVRGWKRQNFWVMETEPGSVNWASVNNALSPGETRALAWQTIGHGADAVLYWQWRSALNGQGAVSRRHRRAPTVTPLAYSMMRSPSLGAIWDLTQRRASPATARTRRSRCCYDYDSRWAIDYLSSPLSANTTRSRCCCGFYTPLERDRQASAGNAVDVVDPTNAGDARTVQTPGGDAIAQCDRRFPRGRTLIAYVQQGGHLLLGSAFRHEG